MARHSGVTASSEESRDTRRDIDVKTAGLPEGSVSLTTAFFMDGGMERRTEWEREEECRQTTPTPVTESRIGDSYY